MAKEHAMQTIATSGMGAIQAAQADMQAQKPGLEAKGKALAATIVHECMAQAGAWTRYYVDLCGLEAWGRAAFRAELNAAVKDKDHKNKVDPVEDRRRASAKVRISEFNTIARAMDAGIVFDPTWAFHYAVGHARVGLETQGAGSTRGRKPTPALDKIKAYLEKNVPANEWTTVAEMVATMAKIHGADAPV